MEKSFGKYRLLQRIGGGQLSQVFRVCSSLVYEEGCGVALKRVNPTVIGEPAFVQLVIREAGILTRLGHAGLCHCLELGVIDGCAFLTLDLVDGCTLRALMRQTSQMGIRLPMSAVQALAYQLAQVLDHLHRGCEQALVHLDLSPQNVMVSRDGGIKLIDFGIARYLSGQKPPPLGGKIAGTVGYMSPEQARGEETDARADQFGLGILLWEMLSGSRLYRGNNAETWRRMQAGETPPIREAFKEIPDPLLEIVDRLMQPEPNRRFEHLGMALQDLEQLSSSPLSGRRPLAALVQRLLESPSFDPFDVMTLPASGYGETDIPQGVGPGEDYAELQIEVERGSGSPASQVRAVLPAGEKECLPRSPFLETIPEAPATADLSL